MHRFGQALSRSYGRCFAEFLNKSSPVHLGTLMPAHLCRITVRILYDKLENFLGSMTQLGSPAFNGIPDISRLL